MQLRRTTHRTADEQDAGGPRDVDRDGRRNRRRRHGRDTGPRRLERQLARNTPGDEQDQVGRRSTGLQRRAKYLVHRIVASDVFRVLQQHGAIGQRSGVNAAGFLVAFAAGEQLLEDQAKRGRVYGQTVG